MFFMKQKSRYNQVDRDEMIAFISRPSKGSTQAQDVKLIRAVERRGMGVPCPVPINPYDPVITVMFHGGTQP